MFTSLITVWETNPRRSLALAWCDRRPVPPAPRRRPAVPALAVPVRP